MIQHKTKINEEGMETALPIDNIDVSCFLHQGTIIEPEVNCNSAFLLENLPLISTEIRRNLHWIPPEESIYLVMDNAGGHGTQEAIEEYTRRLFCSPEVNAFDLGIWMSIQSHIKRRHWDRCRDPDSLAISIEEA